MSTSSPDKWPPAVTQVERGRNGWGFASIPNRAYYCPWWMVLVAWKGAPYTMAVDCQSWWCEKCAPKKANRYIRHLDRRFDTAKRVWFAHTAYDDQKADRIRQRRYAKDAAHVWVRRDSDHMFLFSDEDLGGRKEPKVGSWLPPKGAVQLLAAQALRLPGLASDQNRRAIGISERWAIPADQRPQGTSKRVGMSGSEHHLSPHTRLPSNWCGRSSDTSPPARRDAHLPAPPPDPDGPLD